MSSPTLLPLGLLLIAMISVQLGASIAKSLFHALGAEGATALRLALATAILLGVFRPWRGWRGRPGSALLSYGFALGFMNLFFYLALERIAMGIVVAIEFIGPLGVAIAASRGVVDVLWATMAMAGLALLIPWAPSMPQLDLLGLLFALLAAAGWALYIVQGTRASAAHGRRAAAAASRSPSGARRRRAR